WRTQPANSSSRSPSRSSTAPARCTSASRRRDDAGSRRPSARASPPGPRPRSRPGRRASDALLVALLERLPVPRGVAGDDHGLGVGSVEDLELLQRAAPEAAVEGPRRLGGVIQLPERVDRVTGDDEVAVAQATDDALVPRRVAWRRRQA